MRLITSDEMLVDALINKTVAARLTPVDVEERFCEMLDKGDPVRIGGLEYTPSRVLKAIDPIAFRCGVGDMAGTDDRIVEVEGEYYDAEDVSAIRDEIETEMELNATNNKGD